MRTPVHVQHFSRHLTGFGQINDRVHDVFHLDNLSHLLSGCEQLLRVILVHGSIDDTGRDGVHPYALSRIFNRQAPSDGLQAALGEHRDRRVYSGDRVINHRRGDIHDASAGLLGQHLLDRELADKEEAFDVDGDEGPQIVDRIIREVLRNEHAGVIDEGVDRSEIAPGRFGDLHRRCCFGDAPVHQREPVRHIECTRAGDGSRVRHDVVAAIQKGSYETCSDALGRAGHDCCFPRAYHFKLVA